MSARRRSSPLAAWLELTRTAVRASRRLGRGAARQAPALRRALAQATSGVVSPAPAPEARGRGRWEEGRWGLGPLAWRRYRLFLPPGSGTRRPAPLLVLLHGCGQDSASFAAVTRAAAAARAGGYAVLLPEQAQEANPQRCWQWFGREAAVALEAAVLMAIVDHACNLYPLRRDRVFALGLSAGGAMALTLGLRYPRAFAGVGSHSGAVPGCAGDPVQAAQAMRGRRRPDAAAYRHASGGAPPPLLLIHGDADRTVVPANAEASAQLWLDLAPARPRAMPTRRVRRGKRHAQAISDWRLGGAPYLRLVRIAGLGHAWSGGPARQAFADPAGPDALRLAWRFFARC